MTQKTFDMPEPGGGVGGLLRAWRAARGVSQLDLALEAGISSRHLSYVETGKAQASRKVIVLLGEVLAMPLRERNNLLKAAGYAPAYLETALSAPRMEPVQRAIGLIMAQHEPFPAFVLSRHWDFLNVNGGMMRVLGLLRDGATPHPNMMRQVFDPDDMRPFLANWAEVGIELIRHLHEDVAATPSDATARALLAEVLAYPGVTELWRSRDPEAEASPLLTVVFRKGNTELQFFSTITTFATPRDVTAAEVRIECMFPGDEATAALCRKLAAEAR